MPFNSGVAFSVRAMAASITSVRDTVPDLYASTTPTASKSPSASSSNAKTNVMPQTVIHVSNSAGAKIARFLRLDAYPYRNMMALMARAATTSDVFNAIAEPQRREILVLLRTGERPVTELAQELGMTQPGASKHLRVLREVGLVRDRKAGKQRLYGLDARELRSIHEWTGGFQRFWNESFDRLDAYVQDLKQAKQEE